MLLIGQNVAWQRALVKIGKVGWAIKLFSLSVSWWSLLNKSQNHRERIAFRAEGNICKYSKPFDVRHHWHNNNYKLIDWLINSSKTGMTPQDIISSKQIWRLHVRNNKYVFDTLLQLTMEHFVSSFTKLLLAFMPKQQKIDQVLGSVDKTENNTDTKNQNKFKGAYWTEATQ